MVFSYFTPLLFTVLMMNAQIRCQVVPGSDPNMSCNSCCQGPAGVNGIPGPAGIPGSNGNNGSPGRDGRDGLRGDSGSKGEKGEVGIGEIGLQGPEGPSGDRGDSGLRGLPGKIGPRGPVSPSGLNGAVGAKGEKGSRGDSGRIRESAFSVYKSSAQTAAASNEVITFDEAHANIGGQFDMNTNRFTCQIAGTYFFSYSANIIGINNPDICLVKDGVIIALARSTTADTQVSNSVVLEMEVGNQVWLRFWNDGEGVEGGTHTKFSGFLLYEH